MEAAQAEQALKNLKGIQQNFHYLLKIISLKYKYSTLKCFMEGQVRGGLSSSILFISVLSLII